MSKALFSPDLSPLLMTETNSTKYYPEIVPLCQKLVTKGT